MTALDISVVIATYNRCETLPRALESVLNQDAGSIQYEVIVVDNNSTDCTRGVVATLMEGGETRLRYVFEGKQGVAHARNAGIAAAVAPIVAFTDDDLCAASSWLTEIKRALDEHPEVDSVGGAILPRWPVDPPAWLTRDHWVGPLALQEYGPEPFYVNAERPLSLATANLAFRRSVFERIGGFNSAFPVSEDTEMVIRLFRNNMQSLYAPSILVTADVQSERLEKRYHRRWFFRMGRAQALMRFLEIFDRDGRLSEEAVSSRETLFGIPAFIYRALLSEVAGWLGAAVRRRESAALRHGNQVHYLVGYISSRYEQTKRERSRWCVPEVWRFAASILKRKTRKVREQMLRGSARPLD